MLWYSKFLCKWTACFTIQVNVLDVWKIGWIFIRRCYRLAYFSEVLKETFFLRKWKDRILLVTKVSFSIYPWNFHKVNSTLRYCICETELNCSGFAGTRLTMHLRQIFDPHGPNNLWTKRIYLVIYKDVKLLRWCTGSLVCNTVSWNMSTFRRNVYTNEH